ncbi:hypothetical protein ABFS82_14G035400 [Erythranthe guttata]
MKISLLLIFVISFYLVHTIEAFHFTKKYEVGVSDDLPANSNSLVVHCASKDDDLGRRTISHGQSFNWSFHSNFFQSTLYFCHFWWGPHKQRAFVVYDDTWEELHDVNNYVVKSDGFYVNYGNADPLIKIHSWE